MEGKSLKQLHLIVSGEVQGVGFRYYAQTVAVEQHIKGWVKNRPDGSVEIVAKGKEEHIKTYLKLIEEGSPFSVVNDVEVTEQTISDNFHSFTIKY